MVKSSRVQSVTRPSPGASRRAKSLTVDNLMAESARTRHAFGVRVSQEWFGEPKRSNNLGRGVRFAISRRRRPSLNCSIVNHLRG